VDKNNNQLSVQRHDRLGSVKSDATKVRQILYNLISNATKFTSDGDITLDIQRTNMENRDYIKINILDTGIGMSPLHIAQIFHPFSQADNSTTRK
jgi:signal transduction histidine kinase